MTNTYQSNNGTLQKSTYGNGDYREYSYDSVGRTTLIKRNGSNSYYWRYNANGNVGLNTDYVNDRVYYYTYDSLGRVVEELEKTYGESEYRFESDYVYDVSNNLKKVVNRADGIVVSTAYTYDSINRPTKTTINSSVNYTYAYDTLGRFSQFYLNGTNKNVLVDYDYYNAKSRTSTDTVTYKTSQIAREKIEDRGYYYTYDRLGNIIQIDEKTADSSTYKVKATYTYDQWGQLKTEINVDLGQKIVYTYDTGGNITSKKIYAYTNGTVGSLIDTINYTYNTTWKDKLASYDGQTITYDSIGNPKTYRDGMSFTWNGRQMKTANLNGTSVTYKYNSDGQRTYKKVGSTIHEYEYSNGRLYYEKRGDIQFYYRYDAMGNLAALYN